MPRTRTGKRSGRDSVVTAKEEELPAETGAAAAERASIVPDEEESAAGAPSTEKPAAAEDGHTPSDVEKRMTMAERQAKMKALRQRMADSTKANRKAVASELNQNKKSSRSNGMTAHKLERAERVLDQRDASERGEDYERTRSWAYTIEENEKWDEKLAQKEAKKDQGYIDPHSASERTYQRLVSHFKPEAKSRAGGSGSADAGASASSSALTTTRAAHPSEDEERLVDRERMRYGLHKPDDAALDRVASYLNSEAEVRAKRSRHRADDPDAEVNYINDKNKHFNKKIKRYYDQHTVTIRENFERGTAL